METLDLDLLPEEGKEKSKMKWKLILVAGAGFEPTTSGL